MVKWTVDLCGDLPSPSLDALRSLKCHGPIGGEYAYIKLEQKQCIPGSYIIRQCEKTYEQYFIDIITKSWVHCQHVRLCINWNKSLFFIGLVYSVQSDSSRPTIETFKITQKFNTWELHLQDITKIFNSLTELAKSITTDSKQKFRLAPSDYGKQKIIPFHSDIERSWHSHFYADKSPSILLCLPPQQLTAKISINEHSEFQMRKKRAQLLHPVKDFRKYISKWNGCKGFFCCCCCFGPVIWQGFYFICNTQTLKRSSRMVSSHKWEPTGSCPMTRNWKSHWKYWTWINI